MHRAGAPAVQDPLLRDGRQVQTSLRAVIVWFVDPPFRSTYLSLVCQTPPALLLLWGAEHGEKWEIAEIADFQFFDKWTNFIFSVRWCE